MPERLVRQRRGLVDLYRITSSQRAEHAAVFLLRRAHFTTLGDDVPRVAPDGRARRLREGLSCCSREDGEHLCLFVAASAATGAVERAFFVVALCGSVDLLRVFSRCPLSRGVVKRPTEGGNAFSFASAATNATRCGCSAGLGRLPRRAAPVRLPACRRAIRGENATQRRVHNVRVSIELKLEGHLKAAARDVRSFACTYSCL